MENRLTHNRCYRDWGRVCKWIDQILPMARYVCIFFSLFEEGELEKWFWKGSLGSKGKDDGYLIFSILGRYLRIIILKLSSKLLIIVD